jgi:hypothetical protein
MHRRRRRPDAILAGAAAMVAIGMGWLHPSTARAEPPAVAWRGLATAAAVEVAAGQSGGTGPALCWSRSAVDSASGGSEASAAFGPTVGAQEAHSSNPDRGGGPQEAVTPLGRAGPRARAETHDPMTASSDCRVELEVGAATVEPGRAGTAVAFGGAGRLTAGATAVLHDAGLGRTMRAGTVESTVRLEFELGHEPVVSYRLTLAEVSSGGQIAAGADGGEITVAGRRIPAGRVVDDFNRQAAGLGSLLPGKGSIRLLAPTIEREPTGEVRAVGAAVDVRASALPSGFGLRLGAVEVRGLVASVGSIPAGTIAFPPIGPGGPPMDAPPGTTPAGSTADGKTIPGATVTGTLTSGHANVGRTTRAAAAQSARLPPSASSEAFPAGDRKSADRGSASRTLLRRARRSALSVTGSEDYGRLRIRHRAFMVAAAVFMVLSALRGIGVSRRAARAGR